MTEPLAKETENAASGSRFADHLSTLPFLVDVGSPHGYLLQTLRPEVGANIRHREEVHRIDVSSGEFLSQLTLYLTECVSV